MLYSAYNTSSRHLLKWPHQPHRSSFTQGSTTSDLTPRIYLCSFVCMIRSPFQLEVTLTKKSPADWPELEGKGAAGTALARPTERVSTSAGDSSAVKEPPTKLARPYSGTKNWDVVRRQFMGVSTGANQLVFEDSCLQLDSCCF